MVALLNVLLAQAGVAHFSAGNLVMIAAGAGLIALGAAWRYEAWLLAGVGFACVVANVPASSEGVLFHYAYLGMDLIIPSLIALGAGAMADFGPAIANPRLIIFGAVTQIGVVVALVLATALGFTLKEAGAIGMIGGANGPLAIFVTAKLAPHLLGPVSVAAFSFMALMPLMQQRMMRMLGSNEMQAAAMAPLREATTLEKIAFPLIVAVLFNVFFPSIAPIVTMVMLGNLLKEVEATGRLARTAAQGVTNAAIIALSVAIGSAMAADKFLKAETAEIVALGFLALACGAASSVAAAKLVSPFLKTPMGYKEVAPAAMTASISQAVPEQDRNGALIPHAMGPDLAGIFGGAILSGILLAALGVN
jgi:carboxybiotin decarboxylase